ERVVQEQNLVWWAALQEGLCLPDYPASFAVAHDPILCLDEANRVIAVNSAAPRLFGSSSEELVGLSLIDLVHPDEREQVAVDWSAARVADHIVELTCRIRGSEGAHRALALRCGLDARSGALVIAGREASPLEEMRAQRD